MIDNYLLLDCPLCGTKNKVKVVPSDVILSYNPFSLMGGVRGRVIKEDFQGRGRVTELTDKQINKRLHEILGICFHEWRDVVRIKSDDTVDDNPWEYKCKNCGIMGVSEHNYNFTRTWDAFGLMWEFMQKHERRGEFFTTNNQHPQESNFEYIDKKLISPRSFAEAIYDFFKEDNP